MDHSLESFQGELVKMVEQKWIGRIVIGMSDAIEKSFRTDVVLRPVKTKNEIRRRFSICMRWFVVMRRDLKWAVPRILDEIPIALRTELDGGRFEPREDRQAWIGQGTEDLEIAKEDPDYDYPLPEEHHEIS